MPALRLSTVALAKVGSSDPRAKKRMIDKRETLISTPSPRHPGKVAGGKLIQDLYENGDLQINKK